MDEQFLGIVIGRASDGDGTQMHFDPLTKFESGERHVTT